MSELKAVITGNDDPFKIEKVECYVDDERVTLAQGGVSLMRLVRQAYQFMLLTVKSQNDVT